MFTGLSACQVWGIDNIHSVIHWLWLATTDDQVTVDWKASPVPAPSQDWLPLGLLTTGESQSGSSLYFTRLSRDLFYYLRFPRKDNYLLLLGHLTHLHDCYLLGRSYFPLKVKTASYKKRIFGLKWYLLINSIFINISRIIFYSYFRFPSLLLPIRSVTRWLL